LHIAFQSFELVCLLHKTCYSYSHFFDLGSPPIFSLQLLKLNILNLSPDEVVENYELMKNLRVLQLKHDLDELPDLHQILWLVILFKQFFKVLAM